MQVGPKPEDGPKEMLDFKCHVPQQPIDVGTWFSKPACKRGISISAQQIGKGNFP